MFCKRPIERPEAKAAPIGAGSAHKKAKLEPQPPSEAPPAHVIKMPQEEADAAVACLHEHLVDSLVISVEAYEIKDSDFIADEAGNTMAGAVERIQGIYWSVGVHLDRPVFKQVLDPSSKAERPLYIFWVQGQDGGWYVADKIIDHAAQHSKDAHIVERTNYNQLSVVKHANDIQHNSVSQQQLCICIAHNTNTVHLAINASVLADTRPLYCQQTWHTTLCVCVDVQCVDVNVIHCVL